MSWIALGWASKQKPGRVADKMVLIALADRHSEESGISYPSVAWLAEFSCLDRKTVVAALDRLEAVGLIADSGQRVGKTKQVKAYTLNLNSTEKGIPKTEPLEAKSTAFPGKQYRKRDTEPSLEPSSSSEPKGSFEEGSAPQVAPAPDDRLTVQEVTDGWNDLADAHGLARIVKLPEARRRKVQTQIRQFTVDDWVAVFAKIAQSPFLKGANERGWRCDFDFILSPSNFTKILEGKYDRQPA